jgi:hypothetical protein
MSSLKHKHYSRILESEPTKFWMSPWLSHGTRYWFTSYYSLAYWRIGGDRLLESLRPWWFQQDYPKILSQDFVLDVILRNCQTNRCTIIALWDPERCLSISFPFFIMTFNDNEEWMISLCVPRPKLKKTKQKRNYFYHRKPPSPYLCTCRRSQRISGELLAFNDVVFDNNINLQIIYIRSVI